MSIFIILNVPVLAQDNQLTDSLSTILQAAKNDTNKVILLNDLAWELKFDNPKQARTYLDSALILAQSLNFKKGEGNAHNYRGVVEDIHGNSNLAIQFFQKALTIRQEIGDRKGVASLFNNIGNLNENQGDYDVALANYKASLRLREELKDTIRMGRLYNNISILHERTANYTEALDFCLSYLLICEATSNQTGMANAYNLEGNIKTELDRLKEANKAYQTALRIHRKEGNKWEEGSVLNNLGNLQDTYGEKDLRAKITPKTIGYFEKAVVYFNQSLTIRESLNDKSGKAEIFNNLGYVLKNKGTYWEQKEQPNEANQQWQAALENLNKALDIRLNLKDAAGVMEAYNGIADVYRRQKKYQKALDYTQRYFDIAEQIGAMKFQQNGFKDFARIYYNIGQYQKAYDYRKKYDNLRYELFTDEQTVINARRESFYSDGKKQLEIAKQRRELVEQEAKLERATFFRNSLITGTLGLVLLLGLLFNQNRIKTKSNEKLANKNAEIDAEKERAEALLLNILPKETARELQEFGKAKAVRYESVTVLFTDFKSFTQIAEQLSPEDLVDKLDECFRAFDDIVERHNLEKIKTIGDAYMCAGGLPTKNVTHALDVVAAAIEIRDFIIKFNQRQVENSQPKFEIRLGVNTGPVVAGVVGSKKFAYDIWGDAVNLAARMEENSASNEINISQSTFNLVKDQYICVRRGKLNAKNKGQVEMFFVKSSLAATSMEYNDAKKFILGKLEKELNSNLFYHGMRHTLDVLNMTEELCLAEKINSYETLLLKTAALFHDAGFTVNNENHEVLGCDLAHEYLPRFGYTNEEIERICGMVMATKIPQSPANHLEEIICDADLDYLGRDDFYSIGQSLFEELQAYNVINDMETWNRIQVSFLTAHGFFTDTNKTRRAPVKAEYLQELKEIVAGYEQKK
jgi:adenylate cyclase